MNQCEFPGCVRPATISVKVSGVANPSFDGFEGYKTFCSLHVPQVKK